MSQYSQLPPDEIEELLSNYLISHWSISAVRSFIRNEKDFEKSYIFKDISRLKGLSSIIGTVYHKTLMEEFLRLKAGDPMGYDAMAMLAHDELEKIGADEYKVTDNKPLVEMQNEALEKSNYLITNFLSEIDSYTKEIKDILFVEEPILEFVTIEGVDIPIPLKAIPDVVYINMNDELCILDHKSKKAYTQETDVVLQCSLQSTAYALGVAEKLKRPEYKKLLALYPKIKDGVKYFRYYENKYTKNRDGSRQIRCIDIQIDETKKMYEAILFEGVWRMLKAVQDPDYVYLMNPDDHFPDGGELVDFWVKTRIEGIEGFPNLDAKQKKLLSMRKKDVRSASLARIPKAVIKAFKEQAGFVSFNSKDMADLTLEERIEHRLKCLNFNTKVVHKIKGYSCDTYLLEVGAGMKIGTIFGYRMDIANAMGVADIRINKNLVQYGESSYIAIEVNTKDRSTLEMKASDCPADDLLIPLGKDNFGNTISWDLGNDSTPHILISGATGSGKSIVLKTIIQTAMHKGIEVSIIDPKRDKHFKNIQTYKVSDIKDIEVFLEKKVAEMDAIYKKGGFKSRQIIIFDEANDCFTRQTRERKVMATVGEYVDGTPKKALRRDENFRTLEDNTMLLAQKARSAGIHLVLASQRFSVKVLNGDAKANFPARLCLTVTSAVDSKVALDEEGAEKLNGRGDALFKDPTMPEPKRIQTFIIQ